MTTTGFTSRAGFWHDAPMPAPLLIQFIACPLVLFSLLWVTAPYGRHYQPGWGPTLPNRLAWVLMELPALGLITILVLTGPARESPVALMPLGFWVFHYGYRALVFPALMRPSIKTFPAQLVIFAIAFNGLNGYNNAHALQENASSGEPLLSTHLVLGCLIFMAGFVMHAHSDTVIRRLRKPGESGYRIPQGGMFRWVASPHYLGEIIQWAGWAVMTWSLAGLAFALFTFCNLAPRALSNHRWYWEKFDDYPRKRKILVPGVF